MSFVVVTMIIITLLGVRKSPDIQTHTIPEMEPTEEEHHPKKKEFLKVYTKAVWPGQNHGDWLLRRSGFKNKITIYNRSDRILTAKIKPHPVFSSVSARDISCVCNTEYDEGEETLFPGEKHQITMDTYRCNIEIMEDEQRIFKKLCASSQNVIIEKLKLKRRALPIASCCIPPSVKG